MRGGVHQAELGAALGGGKPGPLHQRLLHLACPRLRAWVADGADGEDAVVVRLLPEGGLEHRVGAELEEHEFLRCAADLHAPAEDARLLADRGKGVALADLHAGQVRVGADQVQGIGGRLCRGDLVHAPVRAPVAGARFGLIDVVAAGDQAPAGALLPDAGDGAGERVHGRGQLPAGHQVVARLLHDARLQGRRDRHRGGRTQRAGPDGELVQVAAERLQVQQRAVPFVEAGLGLGGGQRLQAPRHGAQPLLAFGQSGGALGGRGHAGDEGQLAAHLAGEVAGVAAGVGQEVAVQVPLLNDGGPTGLAGEEEVAVLLGAEEGAGDEVHRGVLQADAGAPVAADVPAPAVAGPGGRVREVGEGEGDLQGPLARALPDGRAVAPLPGTVSLPVRPIEEAGRRARGVGAQLQTGHAGRIGAEEDLHGIVAEHLHVAGGFGLRFQGFHGILVAAHGQVEVRVVVARLRLGLLGDRQALPFQAEEPTGRRHLPPRGVGEVAVHDGRLGGAGGEVAAYLGVVGGRRTAGGDGLPQDRLRQLGGGRRERGLGSIEGEVEDAHLVDEGVGRPGEVAVAVADDDRALGDGETHRHVELALGELLAVGVEVHAPGRPGEDEVVPGVPLPAEGGGRLGADAGAAHVVALAVVDVEGDVGAVVESRAAGEVEVEGVVDAAGQGHAEEAAVLIHALALRVIPIPGGLHPHLDRALAHVDVAGVVE